MFFSVNINLSTIISLLDDKSWCGKDGYQQGQDWPEQETWPIAFTWDFIVLGFVDFTVIVYHVYYLYSISR